MKSPAWKTPYIVPIGEERERRGPKCEWCNEPSHPTPLLCPRVTSVCYGHDEVTVYFHTTPLVIAMKDLPSYASMASDD